MAEYLGFQEPKIIDWLLDNSNFKKLLEEQLFHDKKNVRYFKCVQETFTQNGENPGDINIIAFCEISESIAFECKIVKATSQKNAVVKVNKADKLNEGAWQANHYLKFGFSQVYLIILILDDGRNYDKPNFIFNRTPDSELSEVYDGSWKCELDKNIGIIFCTIEQTRNLNVDINNSTSLRVERKANIIPQKEHITEKIQSLLH